MTRRSDASGGKSERGGGPDSGKVEFLALGSDPFDDIEDADPFLESLSALGLEPDAISRIARSGPGTPTFPHRGALPRSHYPPSRNAVTPTRPTPIRARRWTTTPMISDVDVPEDPGWLDRLLPEAERRRLAALSHLVEGDGEYDRFGFAPDVARKAFPIFYALHRVYFRVVSQGADHLPVKGPAILACNHGGLLPFDGAMIVIDVLLHTDPPRLVRAIIDRWAGSLPWVNVFYARVGQVVGTRENMADLLGDGQLTLVFPEGMDGVRKPVSQRYRLQHFTVGFVEQSLRAGVPIVPMAVLGSDDQAPILYDLKGLAKRLGLPMLPITPTFPWLGPLGLLPYPVSYRIVYGEPLAFHDRFGPGDADDPRLVRYLANKVRASIQLLLDRNR